MEEYENARLMYILAVRDGNETEKAYWSGYLDASGLHLRRRGATGEDLRRADRRARERLVEKIREP